MKSDLLKMVLTREVASGVLTVQSEVDLGLAAASGDIGDYLAYEYNGLRTSLDIQRENQDLVAGMGLVERVLKSDEDAMKLKYFKAGMTRAAQKLREFPMLADFGVIAITARDNAAKSIEKDRDNLKPEDMK